MRANKLKTALSRDRLACLAPPDMVFAHGSRPSCSPPLSLFLLSRYEQVLYKKLPTTDMATEESDSDEDLITPSASNPFEDT